MRDRWNAAAGDEDWRGELHHDDETWRGVVHLPDWPEESAGPEYWMFKGWSDRRPRGA